MAYNSNECWYKFIDNNFKIDEKDVKNLGIIIDKCVECKSPIISNSYQQVICGSRFCEDCYKKLKPKFYCKVCKFDDPVNVVHKKEDIFLDIAFKNDLKKMKFVCPDCAKEVLVIDLHDHATINCKMKWVMCNKCKKMCKKILEHECIREDNSNEESIIVAKKHCADCWKELLDDESHQCKMSSSSSCPFDCTDQNYTSDHRKEAALKHLDKMWAKCQDLKMTDCKKADDSPEYQAWYNSTVASVKSALQLDPNKLKSLRNEVKALKNKLAEEKSIHDQIIKNLLSQASEFLNTNFDGTIMWRLDNFSKLKDEANKGSQVKVFSPPFYTSRFGYKMCLLLYPNGDSSVTGKAMSIFLVIMKGNYDALLRWPFQQKVTFVLMDQQLTTNISQSFFPAVNLPSFSMPKTDMSPPAGISSFVKFDNSRTFLEKYFRNDTVFIHGIVDCADLHE